MLTVQLAKPRVRPSRGALDQLAGDQRRDADKVVDDPLVDQLLRRPAFGKALQRRVRLGEQRQLLERRRQMVKQPRQQRAIAVRLKCHAAHAVEDAPLRVEQNEVRAAAHRLQHQLPLAGLPQLVGDAEGQNDDALQIRLLDGLDARADKMLAQQHAEHRRLRRIVMRLLRKLDARLVWVHAQQHPLIAAHEQHDAVAHGLLHLVDTRAQQRTLQLVDDGAQANRVK